MGWSTYATGRDPGYRCTTRWVTSSRTSRSRGSLTRHLPMGNPRRAEARLWRSISLTIQTRGSCTSSTRIIRRSKSSTARPARSCRASVGASVTSPVNATGLRQSCEQPRRVGLTTANRVDVRDDMEGLAASHGSRCSDGESFVGALVVVAQANRLESVPKLLRVRGHSVGVERLLILPQFNDREMTRPTNLLEQVEANVTVLPAARVAIRLERCECRRPR